MNVSELVRKVYSRAFASNSKLLKESDVFCMAPWIQLHAQTNGKAAPCCMSAVHNGNEISDLRENPDLTAAWNSDNMKQLRLNMLKGEKSTICKHCYEYESLGKFSERNQYNKDYKSYYSRVMGTNEDGSVDDTSVPLIDIRFSNKCNYKCRICDSAYSNLWYEEEKKIGKPTAIPTAKEMKVAFDEETFWKSYQKLLPGVKRLHFAGGEPLIMEEHYKALDYLISIGKTDVTLSYNTNFSTLKYKQYDVVDMWNNFEKVDVWASLDDMGIKGDYQRKGQRWKKIEENIRTIQEKCPKVLFGVNVTVSMLNVLSVPDFYRYMVDNNFVAPERMNLYLLFDPDYYNITNLTPLLKDKVRAKYKAFDEEYLSTIDNNANIRNHMNAILNFMDSGEGEKQEEFKHWIIEVDKLRNENFKDVFPELEEMI